MEGVWVVPAPADRSVVILQADMYRCSTNCCEDKNLSLEEVQNCIDRCSTKVNRAQNYIQGEIQMFQVSLYF